MKNVKMIREYTNVSQQKIADYLGVTRQSYSNYEIGKRQPDNATVNRLAEFFRVPPSFIRDEKPFTQWLELKLNKEKILTIIAQWIGNSEYTKNVTTSNDDVDYIQLLNTLVADVSFTNDNEIILSPTIPQNAMRAYLSQNKFENKQENKPATERDKLISENINLFEQLPTDKKQQALDYLRYLVEHQEKE